MFSTRSNSCIINPFFYDPVEFAPIMDIYSLESIQLSQYVFPSSSPSPLPIKYHSRPPSHHIYLTNAQSNLPRLIQSRITSLGPTFVSYNATLLNSTSVSDSIQSAIKGNDINKPGFMFATLRAGNATAEPDTTPGDDGANNGSGGNGSERGHVDAGGGGGKKNLAMCVFVFLLHVYCMLG